MLVVAHVSNSEGILTVGRFKHESLYAFCAVEYRYYRHLQLEFVPTFITIHTQWALVSEFWLFYYLHVIVYLNQELIVNDLNFCNYIDSFNSILYCFPAPKARPRHLAIIFPVLNYSCSAKIQSCHKGTSGNVFKMTPVVLTYGSLPSYPTHLPADNCAKFY